MEGPRKISPRSGGVSGEGPGARPAAVSPVGFPALRKSHVKGGRCRKRTSEDRPRTGPGATRNDELLLRRPRRPTMAGRTAMGPRSPPSHAEAVSGPRPPRQTSGLTPPSSDSVPCPAAGRVHLHRTGRRCPHPIEGVHTGAAEEPFVVVIARQHVVAVPSPRSGRHRLPVDEVVPPSPTIRSVASVPKIQWSWALA
jgi:hypothetical protein